MIPTSLTFYQFPTIAKDFKYMSARFQGKHTRYDKQGI